MTKNTKIDLVKFRYKNERLLLLVMKETDTYYYGTVVNKPIYPVLNYGDKRRVLKTDVLDIDYLKSVSYTHLTLPTNREV